MAGLTSVSDHLVAVALRLGNLVAVLGVVKRGIVRVVVPGRGRGRFGAAVHREVPGGSHASSSYAVPAAVVVVRCPVSAVLGAVLVVFWGAVGWVVILRPGGED